MFASLSLGLGFSQPVGVASPGLEVQIEDVISGSRPNVAVCADATTVPVSSWTGGVSVGDQVYCFIPPSLILPTDADNLWVAADVFVIP